MDEQIAKDRATRLLPRHVAVVIGGGSGIGKSAAIRFVEEGAHVVVGDLDGAAAERVAQEAAARAPGASDRSPRWTCGTTRASTPCSVAPCWSSADSTRCSTPPARRRASRRSPRSGGRTCSASSRCTTSARCSRSAAPRRSCGGRGWAARSWPRCRRRRWPRAGRRGLRREQGRAAPGAPGRRGGARPRRHPGERDQRRPDRHPDLPPLRRGARRQPRRDRRRSSWRPTAGAM